VSKDDQQQNADSWDAAIREAKRQLRITLSKAARLEEAVKTLRGLKKAGMPFPKDKEADNAMAK
jgi:hypothetical protein